MKHFRFRKQTFLVAIPLLLIVLSLAYIGYGAENQIQVANQHEERYPALAQTDLDGLDDVIHHADYIVTGTVIAEEKFNDSGTYTFTFQIEENIMGNINEETIDVYEKKGDLEVGKSYLLALEYWESVMYPRPVYTSVLPNYMFEIDEEGTIVTSPKLPEGITKKEELVQYIHNQLPNRSLQNIKTFHFIEEAADTSELISISDHIIQLKPISVLEENKYIRAVRAEVINEFKGEANLEIFTLPADVEIGEEYLIFLTVNQGGESMSLATRNGSVIKKGDAAWDEAISLLHHSNGPPHVESTVWQ